MRRRRAVGFPSLGFAILAIGIAAQSADIHEAALKGDLSRVQALVAQDPALVDAEKAPNRKTALHYAAQGGHVAVVAFLLDHGAQVNRPNAAGETALHHAVGLDDPATVTLLLARGADVRVATEDGSTPLQMAAAAGYGRIVSLLLARGAHRDARDSQGVTPGELAARYGHRRIVQSLGGGTGLAGTGGRPSSARGLLARPPRNGEATVWYLGHSGWAVRTANHLLVFDYARSGRLPDEPSLANGMLVPAEIGTLPVTVFISHDHRDHFAPSVFDLRDAVKPITYVTGFRPEAKAGFVEMGPRESRTFDGLEVTSVESTDAGVGFVVRADGVTLFHGGDLCNPRGESGGTFKGEIDFLADHGWTADAYFAAARGCGQPEGIRNGIAYAANRLSARAIFPMHGGGREASYRDLADELAKAGLGAPVHAAEFPGDRFTIGVRDGRTSAAAGSNAGPGGSSDLAAVLRRAGEVVLRHARESTVILADEVCRQDVFVRERVGVANLGGVAPRSGVVPTTRRRWKGELARILLPADGRHQAVPWLELRDIGEVDGRPLPDRGARLERMTRTGEPWTPARARAIVEDNARFNVGPARRTINSPTVPLLVLNPPNQRRFTFEKSGEERVGRVFAWKVGFREVAHPTIVRTFDGRLDSPMTGWLWIDPASGETLRVELWCGPASETRLSVIYGRHDRFGVRLPVEMKERTTGDNEWVEGKCTYSNFRRFETSGRLVVPK